MNSNTTQVGVTIVGYGVCETCQSDIRIQKSKATESLYYAPITGELQKERDRYKDALEDMKAKIEYAYSPTDGPDSAKGWTDTAHRHGSAETAILYAVICSALGK